MQLPVSNKMNYLKKLTLLLFFLCSGLACAQKETQAPIASEKMGKILLDIHLAEAYSIGLGDSSESGPKRFEKNYDSLKLYYATILAHHQLSLDEFYTSLNWYRDHPGIMDTLYLDMLEDLLAEKSARNIPDLEAGDIPDEAGIETASRPPVNALKPLEEATQAADTVMPDSSPTDTAGQ